MKLLLWELIHSDFVKVILLCLIANIWMFRQGWYKSDEYYLNFSLKGNTVSLLPFIPKFFSLIFAYYIAALHFGGMMHETRYIPLIICFFIYLGITFGYFHAYKNKRWFYLSLFSAAFLISTVPHYLLVFFQGTTNNSGGKHSDSQNTYNGSNSADNFDSTIIQQRENYYKNQDIAESKQAEINANSMGFHSAEEARRNGMDV